MGCRIISSNSDSVAVMYDSVTDWAFGPVFYDEEGHDATERVELFIKWLQIDPRSYPDNELAAKYHDWRAQEKEQWAAIETAIFEEDE